MRSRAVGRLSVAWAAAIALALLVAATPEAAEPSAQVPTGFQDSVVFSGLREPVAFRFSPDGRVFVAEKRGEIVVFDGLEDETPTLFADLRKQVYDYMDHGLLGLALAPGFPEDPHVYALYTFNHVLGEEEGSFPAWEQPSGDPEGDPSCTDKAPSPVDSCPVSGRLVRLVDEGGHAKGGAATPQEDVLITDWCQQGSTHSIGDLEFGSEGALYASGGEGALPSTPDYGQYGWPQLNQCGDPPGTRGEALSLPDAEGGALRSQDLLTPATPEDPTGLSGTVIRIDPATGEGMPENPFHDSGSANERRIVAFGLRNPFRFAISPETGEVYVNNVGGGPIEEIDRFAAIPETAYNSGWPCFEGSHPNEVFQELHLDLCERLYEAPGSTSAPFFAYSHHYGVSSEDPCPIENGSAISGSTLYEEGPFPDAYDGALFFADSVRGCVYVMFPGADGRPDPTTIVPFVHESDPYAGVDVQVGPDGALYYAALFGPGYGPGSIHRVSYYSDNQPPVARLTATPEWGPELPEGFHSMLDASGSSDPEGEALTYEWDLDGDGTYELSEAGPTQEVTYHDEGEHFVAVRVRDEKDAVSVARVNLYPGDSPPQVEIVKPIEGEEAGAAEHRWAVGDPIEFEGVAHDAEDAEEEGEAMPATSLDWSSRLYHCPGEGGCHAHPLQAFPSVASGVLTAPDHEYPSRIELKLTATDSRGLSASASIQVYPKPVEMTLLGDPGGVPLSAGFDGGPAPFSFTAIQGSNVTISAPLTYERDAKVYDFESWSDGGARVHTIEADPSRTKIEAYFALRPAAAPGGTTVAPLVQPAGILVLRSVRIDAHPRRRTRRRAARFRFHAAGFPGGFACRVDRRPFRGCAGSGRTYRHLGVGGHVFRVHAMGPDGTPYSADTRFRWRVLPRARHRRHRR
jgi:glucose/arabinose dehydrogenase